MRVTPEEFKQMQENRARRMSRGSGKTLVEVFKEEEKQIQAKAREVATHEESKLNKTEAQWLRIARASGKFRKIGIQDMTLKLGDNCRFTPDFRTIDEDGHITFWDVKGGHTWEDAIIKNKAAARLFPEFRFVITKLEKGRWNEREMKP